MRLTVSTMSAFVAGVTLGVGLRKSPRCLREATALRTGPVGYGARTGREIVLENVGQYGGSWVQTPGSRTKAFET